MRIEFPSKELGETINLPADFISRLAPGETIVTPSSSMVLYSGTDPNPLLMLNGAPTVSGSVITQSITGGVLGNIYELTLTAITSLGQTLSLSGYFAVVPDLP